LNVWIFERVKSAEPQLPYNSLLASDLSKEQGSKSCAYDCYPRPEACASP